MLFRSMGYAEVSIDAATAIAALFGPRRARMRWNCALKYEPFAREAHQALWEAERVAADAEAPAAPAPTPAPAAQ